MSRSYKKNPWATDGSPKTTKEMKRIAQKVVRNSKDVPMKGGSYKKFFESWKIHDYKSFMSWEDFKKLLSKDNYFSKNDFNLKDLYRFWLKCYRTK